MREFGRWACSTCWCGFLDLLFWTTASLGATSRPLQSSQNSEFLLRCWCSLHLWGWDWNQLQPIFITNYLDATEAAPSHRQSHEICSRSVSRWILSSTATWRTSSCVSQPTRICTRPCCHPSPWRNLWSTHTGALHQSPHVVFAWDRQKRMQTSQDCSTHWGLSDLVSNPYWCMAWHYTTTASSELLCRRARTTHCRVGGSPCTVDSCTSPTAFWKSSAFQLCLSCTPTSGLSTHCTFLSFRTALTGMYWQCRSSQTGATQANSGFLRLAPYTAASTTAHSSRWWSSSSTACTAGAGDLGPIWAISIWLSLARRWVCATAYITQNTKPITAPAWFSQWWWSLMFGTSTNSNSTWTCSCWFSWSCTRSTHAHRGRSGRNWLQCIGVHLWQRWTIEFLQHLPAQISYVCSTCTHWQLAFDLQSGSTCYWIGKTWNPIHIHGQLQTCWLVCSWHTCGSCPTCQWPWHRWHQTYGSCWHRLPRAQCGWHHDTSICDARAEGYDQKAPPGRSKAASLLQAGQTAMHCQDQWQASSAVQSYPFWHASCWLHTNWPSSPCKTVSSIKSHCTMSTRWIITCWSTKALWRSRHWLWMGNCLHPSSRRIRWGRASTKAHDQAPNSWAGGSYSAAWVDASSHMPRWADPCPTSNLHWFCGSAMDSHRTGEHWPWPSSRMARRSRAWECHLWSPCSPWPPISAATQGHPPLCRWIKKRRKCWSRCCMLLWVHNPWSTSWMHEQISTTCTTRFRWRTCCYDLGFNLGYSHQWLVPELLCNHWHRYQLQLRCHEHRLSSGRTLAHCWTSSVENSHALIGPSPWTTPYADEVAFGHTSKLIHNIREMNWLIDSPSMPPTTQTSLATATFGCHGSLMDFISIPCLGCGTMSTCNINLMMLLGLTALWWLPIALL